MYSLKNLLSSFLVVFIFVLVSCDEGIIEPVEPSEPTVNNTDPSAYKILPLGDSRVEGGRPEYESYRYELWKKLENSGFAFDYIGTRTDEGSYEAFNGKSFDKDHEGTGGAMTTDNLEILKNTVTAENAPDIVLLGIGGNDLTEGNRSVDATISSLNEIIDYLQSQNANVVIFLEQIAPGIASFMTNEYTTKVNEYNLKIAEVGTNQTDGNSSVIVVDMNTGWSDNYMADEVHYNQQGAEVVAERYFNAIQVFF